MTEVMIAGDTHGNVSAFRYLNDLMQVQGITQGIVVGDFGLWPGGSGKKFLKDLERLCARYGITWWWLDGNHEDHTRIQQWMQRPNAYEQMHKVSDHVWYLPRGYRFEIDDVRFAVLGGAWSIDKDYRTPYVSWWPEEEITEADFGRTVDGGPCDVLLTHDMPNDQEAIEALGFSMRPGGSMNRRYVSEVIHRLNPKLHLHGHMHKRYSTVLSNKTRVEGLDCDNTGRRSWYVLDTEDFR